MHIAKKSVSVHAGFTSVDERNFAQFNVATLCYSSLSVLSLLIVDSFIHLVLILHLVSIYLFIYLIWWVVLRKSWTQRELKQQ